MAAKYSKLELDTACISAERAEHALTHDTVATTTRLQGFTARLAVSFS